MNRTAHPLAARQEITFVLSDLPDLNTLLSSLPIGGEVYVLDADGDALAQMAGILDGREGIGAIHLMSHGGPGSLQLGQTTLNGATLDQHGDTLAAIGAVLSADADLLLYGCNVAAGASGQAFVNALSAATGADVAASEDVTGAAAKGGDWVLEYSSGGIDAATLRNEAYAEILAGGVAQTQTVAPGATNVGFGVQNLNWNGEYVYVIVGTAPSGGVWGLGGTQGAYYQTLANGANTQVVDGGINDVDETDNGAVGISLYIENFTAPTIPGEYTYNFFLQTHYPTPHNPEDPGYGVFTQEAFFFKLIVADPNNAPVATSGDLYVNEGTTNNIDLRGLVSDTETADNDLAFSGTGVDGYFMSYTAATNAALKGSQLVTTQNYTVTDAGGKTDSDTVSIYVNYADDAPTGSTSATGTARVGQLLTAQIGTLSDVDDGGAGVAKTYQWQRLDLTTNTWNNIAGATNQTYTLLANDQNTAVRVKIVYGSPVATIYSAQRFIADADGKTTLAVSGNPPPSIIDPEGDVEVTNSGPTALPVSGIPNGGTLVTKGAADTNLTAPKGDVTVKNEGGGTTTISDVLDTKTVTIGDGGPTGGPVVVESDLASADDYIVVDMLPCHYPTTTVNNTAGPGGGTIKVKDLQDDVLLHVIGTGPVILDSPDGDVVLDKDGTGPLTINDLTAGGTVSDTGTGGGTITVTSPAGDVTTANNNTGGGTIVVTNVVNEGTVTSTGTGPTTVQNPVGDVTVNNTGTGTTTVTGTLNSETVTTQGTGPVIVNSVLNAPGNEITVAAAANKNVTADNDGTGTINVTGLGGESTFRNTGTGTGETRVIDPTGDLTVVNTGNGPVVITDFDNAGTLTVPAESSGPISLAPAAPDSTLNIENEGAGLVTVNTNGGTVTITGDGPVTVVDPSATVTVVNNGTGTVIVPAGVASNTFNASGSDSTITDPTGSITVANAGPGTVKVTGFDDDATLTTTGAGNTLVDTPDGSLTLNNTGGGSVTVKGTKNGETVSVANTNTGPLVVNSVLGGGNGITVDATNAQTALTADNDGAGTISVTHIGEGAVLKSTGASTGTTQITDPTGSFTVENTGTSPVLVTAFDADATLTVTGANANSVTTVQAPGDNATIHNTGSGTVKVTQLTDDYTVNATGTGASTVENPAGNVTLHNSGSGTLKATGVDDGKTATVTGTTATAIENPEGDVTVNNTGSGTATVTGTLNGKTVTTGGAGPVVVNSVLNGANSIAVNVTDNQNVTFDNDGTGTINVTGVTAGSTIQSTGSGTGNTTITDPAGSFTVDNTGTSPVKVTGLDDEATLTVTGSGPVTVDAPAGDVVNVQNNGTGTVTMSNVPAGTTVNCTGGGAQTIDLSSLQSGETVTIHNTGGPVNLVNVPDGVTVVFTGSQPVTVDNLTGTVTLENTGTGLVTVADAADDAVIQTAGTGPLKIDDDVASGETVTVNVANNANVTFDNDGAGTMNVTNVADEGTVTSTGSGSLTVVSPAGDVTLANTGTGTVSATGAVVDATVTTSGTGPTTIINPAGSVNITNTGSGSATVTGAIADATVTTGGSGPIAVNSVLGAGNITIAAAGNPNVTADNDGAGTLTVTGMPEGSQLDSTGSGAGDTILSEPIGNVSVNNTGTSPVKVTGFDTNKTLTIVAGSSGPVEVDAPDGNLAIDNQGTSQVTVNTTGGTVTTSGSGPVEINDSTGTVTVVNNSTGTVTVPAVGGNNTFNASGTNDTTINNPTGDVTVSNTGSGTVTISGVDDSATLTITGSGPTTVANPDGDVTVKNDGTGTATVTGTLTGKTVTAEGAGPVQVNSALGGGDNITVDVTSRTGDPTNVTVNNTGGGTITVNNLQNGETLNVIGTGPCVMGTPAGDVVLDKDGSGPLTINNLAADGTVTDSGSGSGTITISNPAGNVTTANNNTGGGTISVTGVIDNGWVFTTGSGPTTVSNPAGRITVTNEGTGTATVTGAIDEATITTGGTGPIAIVTALESDEKITVYPQGNNELQITNSGAGQVDMQGDLALDDNDTQTYTLNGNGTTVMSLTGTLELDDTPLALNLAGGYTPAAGHIITLISNDEGEAVTGTFAGLAEGASVMVGGHQFRISYVGGEGGNDVVLLRNDAPTINGLPEEAQSVTTSTAADLVNFTVADTENSASLTVTLHPTNGTLGGLTGWTQTGNDWSKTDSAANLNAAIAAATFTATAPGAASIGISVSDGAGAPTTGTYTLAAQSAAPLFGTLSTAVAVFSYPNLNGADATPNQDNENANLASIVQKVINDGGDYTLDVSITSFADANLAAKLNACGFFFMTDMESQNPSNTAFLPDSAKTIIRDWVNNGGVIMMTGTSGPKDVTFLNAIFGWDLTTQTGASWSLNEANAAGTPFAGGPASLNAPSATDSIGKGTVANFTAIYGTDANATVATIGYGAGTVIFLGYDYFSSGFAGTGFTSTATQYGADVTNGASNTNTWVTQMIPRALEYSANLSNGARINETDGALTGSGTLPVSDVDLADTVSVTVTSVAAQQKDGNDANMDSNAGEPGNAALLAMLSVEPTPVVPADATTGTLTWSFNSGAADLDYLAQGEKLVLTYTLIATDNHGATATTTLDLTLVGTNDAPVLSGIPGAAQAITTGAAANLANFMVADADTTNLTVTLTAANGTINGVADADAETPGIQLTGNAAAINAAIAAATFTATANGAASVGVSVSDGVGAPVTATYSLTANPVAVAPADNGGGTPATPPASTTNTIDGVPVSGSTTATTTTITDPATGQSSTVNTQTTTITVPVVGAARQDQDNTTPNADIPLLTDSQGQTVIQASLPTGIGLTSSAIVGSSAGGQTLGLREQLIAASQPRADAASFPTILDQIDSYVPAVQDESQVAVRTIVFQVDPAQTTPPAEPIRITGASGTGEDDGNNPLRQEALVIDARALPSGTVLQFDRVEFAIVIGPARIVGGEGRNLIIGDEAAQFIVLGAGDDVLRGGGGNDTVGSRGGNDQLYGDTGDDRVTGGVGDDDLYGGDGDDILQGGASDAGVWNFVRDGAGQVHIRFNATESALAETLNLALVSAYSRDDSATGNADPRAACLHADPARLEDIALLHHAVYGQIPDNAALNFWAAQPFDSRELANLARIVIGWSGNQNSTEGQVRHLIEQAWGSGSASNALVSAGVQFIEGGGSWADGMLYLARHDAHRAPLLDAQGNLPLMREFNLDETGWSAAAGNNRLYGEAGNDLLVGGSGNNLLDGGSGTDMAVFVGNIRSYALELRQGVAGEVDVVVKNAASGAENVLRGIELLSAGGEIYAPAAHFPAVALGEVRPLADFVRLVGTAELQAMGVPEGWIG